MTKRLLISLAPAAAYIILSIAGLGLSGATGGILYRALIIAYLLYACVLAFKGARRGGEAVLAGALGLGLIAVNEVYLFSYLYLLQGDAADITVANYARNCAYLFFLAVLMYMLPKAARGRNVLLIGATAVSAAAMLGILYGVVANNPESLYYSALTMMVLSVLCAVYLLIAGRKAARPFAVSVIALSVLDTAYRLLTIPLFALGWHWRDIVVSFYPAVYLLIGFALICLYGGLGKGPVLKDAEKADGNGIR